MADTAADTPPNTEADTPPPGNTDNDDVAHVDTVSGPPFGMDPFVTLIPPRHQPYEVSCPLLPRPAKGGVLLAFPSVHY